MNTFHADAIHELIKLERDYSELRSKYDDLIMLLMARAKHAGDIYSAEISASRGRQTPTTYIASAECAALQSVIREYHA